MSVITPTCPGFRPTALARVLLLACLTAGAGFGAAMAQAQDAGAVARTDARDYVIAAGPLDRDLVGCWRPAHRPSGRRFGCFYRGRRGGCGVAAGGNDPARRPSSPAP